MTEPTAPGRATRSTSADALIYALFFGSGASGLVYEVSWVRQFGNDFGNTVQSAALVTAVFMCGLGVGSYAAGAWADRRAHASPALPLRAYGASEIAIAALAALLALLLPKLAAFSASISTYTPGQHGWSVLSTTSYALRYLVAVLALAPVTALMGGTLTLLVRHVVAHDLDKAGLRVGWLYGLNTAGAALGCFLTDFFLVPALGFFATQIAAAALSATVGVAALGLAARAATATATATATTTATATATGDDAPAFPRTVALTCAALFLAGFAALGMEIVWFRVLSASLGAFRPVFSILLTVILVGIWLGSTAGGYATRRFGRPLETFVVTEAAFVLATLALLATYDRASLLGATPSIELGPSALAATASRAIVTMVPIAAVVAIPSFLMGFSFPLANAAVQDAEAATGRRAGVLYLANTLGAVAGSACAGFFLLPTLGSQRSVLVFAFCAAAAGVPLALSATRDDAKKRTMGRALAIGGGLAVPALVGWLALPESHLLGRFLPPGNKVDRTIDLREGIHEIVAVRETPQGARALHTNGHPMSATSLNAQRYMRGFVHIPLLGMEDPKRILVICFGVGNTLSAASLYPSLERLEIADLSTNVLEHAHFFNATNHDVLQDPRVHVFVNDGRQHLRMSPESTFDLVTLEPPPIQFAGVSSLYSREFYELVKSRLKPGGVLTQWHPVYQVPRQTALEMVRAFVDVFPASAVLSGEMDELILLGVNGPKAEFDLDRVEANLKKNPRVQAELDTIRMGTLTELVGTFVSRREQLERVLAPVQPVSDDHPTMEYSVLHDADRVRTTPPELFQLDGLPAYCPKCLRVDEKGAKAPDPRVADLPEYLDVLGALYATREFLTRTYPLIIDMSGGRAETIRKSAYLRGRLGHDDAKAPGATPPAALIARLEQEVAKNPTDIAATHRLAMAYMSARRVDKAIETYRREVALDAKNVPAVMGLAFALAQAERFDEAIETYKTGIALAPRDAGAHYNLAAVYNAKGALDDAIAEVEKALEIAPAHPGANAIMCQFHSSKGDATRAAPYCEQAAKSAKQAHGGLDSQR